MHLTRALSNAVSGLHASGRGTETVSANLANIMTPGYARRELSVSSQVLSGGPGGVVVDGISRVVNATLLAETRSAVAGQADARIRSDFATSMEQLVGVPGEAGSLSAALGEFQAALASAGARPDDNVRLTNVVSTANSLAARLNVIGDGIQAARTQADRAIAADVAALNTGLERVADLNRRIASLTGSGIETLSLEDERQSLVDQIASIIPLQQVERPGNMLALFATGGTILLDVHQAARFDFTPAGTIQADMTSAPGKIGQLMIDGKEISPERLSLVGGGSLVASFAVRDQLAPELQREVDAIALDLHDRLADPAVDPTRGNKPGLFTDSGVAATAASITGLSSRLKVNDAVVPSAGGEVWKIRTGLGATNPGLAGDGSLLRRMSGAMTATRTMAAGTFSGPGSAEDFSAQLSSRVGSRRVSTDSELTIQKTRADTLSTRLMADGVDSDEQMQRLIQYENAYAANAKVIKTVDDMLQTLLSI